MGWKRGFKKWVPGFLSEPMKIQWLLIFMGEAKGGEGLEYGAGHVMFGMPIKLPSRLRFVWGP